MDVDIHCENRRKEDTGDIIRSARIMLREKLKRQLRKKLLISPPKDQVKYNSFPPIKNIKDAADNTLYITRNILEKNVTL